MKTLTIETFTYEELSPEAQAKARDWWRELISGDFSADAEYEDAMEIAALMGIEIAKRDNGAPAIYWSGFSSQGDGACFEGSWSASQVKPGAVLEYAPQDAELHRIAGEFERIAKLYPEASFTVKHRGNYSHKMCTEFVCSLGDDEAFDVALKERGIEKLKADEASLVEAARDFMDWIYKQLELQYEYEQKDETVAENIIANDYEFTVEGKRSVTL